MTGKGNRLVEWLAYKARCRIALAKCDWYITTHGGLFGARLAQFSGYGQDGRLAVVAAVKARKNGQQPEVVRVFMDTTGVSEKKGIEIR